MARRIMIDSDGNEHLEEEVVNETYSPFTDEEVNAAIVRDALEEAFNRGRESVFNGEEYTMTIAETAKAEYDRGYKQGYADAIKHYARVHIGDEVYDRFGEKFVITNIDGGSVYGFNKNGDEMYSLIDECMKTGKNYPWIAEIIKELSE